MCRQSIGGEEQRACKQNTQCFHAVTLAFSEFYEIGSTPILMSVFGLQECGSQCFNISKPSKRSLGECAFVIFVYFCSKCFGVLIFYDGGKSVIANRLENPQ
jgi:hypothetical protein